LLSKIYSHLRSGYLIPLTPLITSLLLSYRHVIASPSEGEPRIASQSAATATQICSEKILIPSTLPSSSEEVIRHGTPPQRTRAFHHTSSHYQRHPSPSPPSLHSHLRRNFFLSLSSVSSDCLVSGLVRSFSPDLSRSSLPLSPLSRSRDLKRD
jgi:hypothetical protein